MRDRAAVHDALAALFEYPRAGHAERVRGLAETVAAGLPQCAPVLEPLARFAAESSLGACEELYVRTFDANAERALEVGWQVFGEQYERGAFLVDLRGRMRAAGIAETTELPDHLTQVLRLLARIDEADARALADRVVAPSLKRVRENLDEGNPFAGALDAVAAALATIAPAPAAGGVR